jgi:mevalonate kinase
LLVNTRVPRNTAELVKKVGVFVKETEPEKGKQLLEEIHNISSNCIKAFEDHHSAKISTENLYTLLEKWVERNQLLLTELGVGHPALTQVCEISKKEGFSSKLTGAGGGGCALTLCPPHRFTATNFNTIKTALEQNGFQCFQTDVGGVGVQTHNLKEEFSERILKELF